MRTDEVTEQSLSCLPAYGGIALVCLVVLVWVVELELLAPANFGA